MHPLSVLGGGCIFLRILLTNLYLLYILYIYRQNESVKGAADGTVYQ
ncbi:hypothetical protein FAEPRAM212_00560 [Faecalibacterium prausnitzii M21/2]|uniref:Uncharacterized protein n=1 Tax=Faecalibacterium prausnitzii M21/2 TaxID=411485 RepID=A8S7U2_9FIRM|nr:hypothetical protein FAEPRAM212_00560 [Faecalibacterium prausnitzii M21/2]